MYKIILAPTTSSGTSTSVGLSQDMSAITFVCNGLAGSETATIQIYDPITAAYVNILPLKQMTASINTLTLNQMWGSFVVVKSATAGSVGISANQFIG